MNKYGGKQQGRSGQIPAFGNWDQVKELPITQYFENARQAGLKSTSATSTSHSRELDYVAAPSKKRNPTIKTYSQFVEREKKSDKTGRQKPNQLQTQTVSSGVVSVPHTKTPSIIKPVDEDLYKIPSEALRNSKRNKLFGLFSSCFAAHTL